ncbi:Delta(14)-sterol reductase-like protein [Drosera capensis]
MNPQSLLQTLIPSWTSVGMLLSYLGYLAVFGSVLPGKLVNGMVLADGTRLKYRCNGQRDPLDYEPAIGSYEGALGLLSLILLISLLAIGVQAGVISATAIADKGLEFLSAAFVFSFIVSDSFPKLKKSTVWNLIQDWWYGIQLNPGFLGIDLKLYRAFRGANRKKLVFKKNPEAPIWGKAPEVVGGKLLASGYCGAILQLTLWYMFSSSVLLPDLSSHPVDMERAKRRLSMRREVQGDLVRVLHAQAMENLALCILIDSTECSQNSHPTDLVSRGIAQVMGMCGVHLDFVILIRCATFFVFSPASAFLYFSHLFRILKRIMICSTSCKTACDIVHEFAFGICDEIMMLHGVLTVPAA